MHPCAERIRLHSKYFVALSEISDQWIDLAVQASKHRVVYPGLLNKFELAFNVSIQAKEMESP